MSEYKLIFSDVQVSKLNDHQTDSKSHGYTCCGGDYPNNKNCQRNSRENEGLLLATNEGWVCPCGDYKQYWAHVIND
jgi:hypothetical protein